MTKRKYTWPLLPGLKARDLTGMRFSRVVVIWPVGTKRSFQRIWLCLCDCGRTSLKSSGSLIEGSARSCECLLKESVIATNIRRTQHGHCATQKTSKTYRSWHSAKSRCNNPNTTKFYNYGGRGIRMCERWQNSFENFLADMGERPAGKTLDRYPDPDGNYEPGNCRWATLSEQRNNLSKRRSHAKL